jgi:hypothetical protein
MDMNTDRRLGQNAEIAAPESENGRADQRNDKQPGMTIWHGLTSPKAMRRAKLTFSLAKLSVTRRTGTIYTPPHLIR